MASTYKLYGYRWVVLAVFMFINLTIQILWITYAPILPLQRFLWSKRLADWLTGHVVHDRIHPAVDPSFVGHRYIWIQAGSQYRRGVDGDLWSLARFAGANYSLVLLSTIGIAAAQPFLLQRVDERCPPIGLPLRSAPRGWIGHAFRSGRDHAWHGAHANSHSHNFHSNGSIDLWRDCGFLCNPVCIVYQTPSTPAAPQAQVQALMLDGLKHALTVKSFLLYLVVSFIGAWHFQRRHYLGRNYHSPARIHPTDAGTLGALMLVGGIQKP